MEISERAKSKGIGRKHMVQMASFQMTMNGNVLDNILSYNVIMSKKRAGLLNSQLMKDLNNSSKDLTMKNSQITI